jgi:transposase
MKAKVIFVGLDVHQESIVIGQAAAGSGPPLFVDSLPNDYARLVKRLQKMASVERLRVCYEAGPTGYDLARRLNAEGIRCEVIAPSLIPRAAGCRIKTDRRDAVRLAQLYRAGELTPIEIPDRETEAMRDLERARADAKRDERQARHRLDKFLLRRNRLWSDGKKWTRKHQAWISGQTFEEPAAQATLAHYLRTLAEATVRVEELTREIERLVPTWSRQPLTVALQALRGVQLITAVTFAAEIGDFGRFPHPRQLMAYIGLVPSEHTSGNTRRQGSITRTGNKHVRTLAIEAAWNYRFRRPHSAAIAARRTLVAPEVRAIAEKAERRLTRRFARLVDRGKPNRQAVTAVARELLGFVWAIAQVPQPLAT